MRWLACIYRSHERNVNIEEEMDFVRNGNLKFTVPDYMWGKKVISLHFVWDTM